MFKPQPNQQALQAFVDRIAAALPKDGSDSRLRFFHGQTERLREATDALVNVHERRDPTLTDAGHIKLVATHAASLNKECDAAVSRVNTNLREGIAENDAKIAKKVKLNADPRYEQEIRAAFLRLPTMGERTKQLAEWVEQNDGSALAAIVHAPTFLAGVPSDIQKRFARAIVEKHAPDEVEEEKALMTGMDTALSAVAVAREVAKVYSNPEKMAEILRAQKAAADATEKFKDVTS